RSGDGDGSRPERAFVFATINDVCAVVVEVIARRRLCPAAGSARSTRRSSIACARSSRTPRPPALVGGARSAPRLAAAQAATSLAYPPPRTATRAPRPGTSKRPRSSVHVGSGASLSVSRLRGILREDSRAVRDDPPATQTGQERLLIGER